MTRPLRASGTDACPGALRLHAAADGPLARVRLPGGMLTGAQLAELGAIAAEWGDGGLELTSRANVQLRALDGADPAVLAARLFAAGLLPSQTHETVRNIAAPPLADAVIRDLVRALDEALCADPALAALPGRFLFAIGEVPLAADVAAVASAGGFAILFAGHDEGLRAPAGRVVEALLAGAHAFLAERGAAEVPAWRLAEIPDGPRRIAVDVAAALHVPLTTASSATTPPSAIAPPAIAPPAAAPPATAPPATAPPATAPPATAPPATAPPATAPLVGVVGQPDGRVAAGAIVPLGRLTAVQIKVLSDAPRLALTASRGVVIPDLSPEAAGGWLDALAAAGLAVEADSRWSGVTACAGRPGCAKSLADVRGDALAATRFAEGLPVHWIGCARGCGSPSGAHVRVEATPGGYAVNGKVVDGDLAEIVSAARRP